MKQSQWIIPLLLAFLGIMAVFSGAGPGSAVMGNHAADNPGFDCTPPPPTVTAPEFPTLAVPAGLLVGMAYAIYLMKEKGRKPPFFRPEEKSHEKDGLRKQP